MTWSAVAKRAWECGRFVGRWVFFVLVLRLCHIDEAWNGAWNRDCVVRMTIWTARALGLRADEAMVGHIVSPAGGLAVEPACLGGREMLVVLGAVLALSARVTKRAVLVLGGLIALTCLNVTRMVTLVFALQWPGGQAELVHDWLWPLGMTCIGLVTLAHLYLAYEVHGPVAAVQPSVTPSRTIPSSS